MASPSDIAQIYVAQTAAGRQPKQTASRAPVGSPTNQLTGRQLPIDPTIHTAARPALTVMS